MPAVRSEHLDEAMTTATFHAARAAIVEAHALAQEHILTWRESWCPCEVQRFAGYVVLVSRRGKGQGLQSTWPRVRCHRAV